MPTSVATCLLVLAVCAAILAAPTFVAIFGGLALVIEAFVFYAMGRTNGLG